MTALKPPRWGESSRSRHWGSVLSLTTLMAICLVLGCRSKAANQPGEGPTKPDPVKTTAQANESVSPTIVPYDQLGIQVVTNDPIEKSWSVETFNDKASVQLHHIKKLLLANATVTEENVRDLVAPEFTCGSLTQEDMTTIFHESPLRVRRPSADTSSNRFRHGSGFAEALEVLRSSLPEGQGRKASFKTSSVKEEADGDAATVRSVVEVQLAGESKEGVVQYRAQWHCQWQLTAGELPLLLSLTVAGEEVSESKMGILFTDVTADILGENESFTKQLSHGVDYWLDRIEQRFGINSAGWQGLAVADVNGDNREDVYLCQPGGLPNRLYLQQPDGTAKDASQTAGVDYWDHSHAALFVDFDGDADQDLVLATALGLIFLENDGAAHFSPKVTKLCPEAMPFTLCAADYDQDGDVDVYATCYSPRGKAIATRFLARPVPYHDANNGGRNCLFRNEGNWEFQNATLETGLDENNRRFSLAASWEDFDNDGDQDLYVANDYGRNNLYRNEGGQFADVASQAGVEDISAGMSVSWSDFNHDGWMDLYISNMWSSAGQRITFQRQFQPNSDEPNRTNLQRHARFSFPECGGREFSRC